MKNTYNDVVEAIGHTAMIKMGPLLEKDKVECQIYAKCEYLGVGGSIKDRIGKNMLLEAEKRGEIKKGDYVIESTSGNTGIGIAMTAMNRGMKPIITIPCKMSMEKVNILKGLGAEVHICDTSAPSGHPDK